MGGSNLRTFWARRHMNGLARQLSFFYRSEYFILRILAIVRMYVEPGRLLDILGEELAPKSKQSSTRLLLSPTFPPSIQFQDGIETNAVVIDIDHGSSSSHEKYRGSCSVQRRGPSWHFRQCQPRRRRSPTGFLGLLSRWIQWISRGRFMHSGRVVFRGHAQLSSNLR